MKTYNDIFMQARNALRDHGIEGYSLEARLLVATAAGKTTQELLRDLSLYTSSEMADKVAALTERRISGEPVAISPARGSFTACRCISPPTC